MRHVHSVFLAVISGGALTTPTILTGGSVAERDEAMRGWLTAKVGDYHDELVPSTDPAIHMDAETQGWTRRALFKGSTDVACKRFFAPDASDYRVTFASTEITLDHIRAVPARDDDI